MHSGTLRYTFEVPELSNGISFIVIAMGIFGYAEIIKNLSHTEQRETMAGRISHLYPTREDFRQMMPAMLS